MTRKTRPYLFYDTTSSVCGECLRPVEAKILLKGERVYMDKWCPVHGTERVLVSDDVGLLPRLPRSLRQAARDAAAVQYGNEVRMPVRLRAVSRSHAALVSDDRRDQ
jgi:Predicted Fe-S oxidoreductases